MFQTTRSRKLHITRHATMRVQWICTEKHKGYKYIHEVWYTCILCHAYMHNQIYIANHDRWPIKGAKQLYAETLLNVPTQRTSSGALKPVSCTTGTWSRTPKYHVQPALSSNSYSFPGNHVTGRCIRCRNFNTTNKHYLIEADSSTGTYWQPHFLGI